MPVRRVADAVVVVPASGELTQREAAGKLTFPAYRRFLREENSRRHAVIAVSDGVVAGLALWRCGAPAHQARLLSIAVARDWRRQGLGRRLMETSLRTLPAARARTYWSSRLEHATAFAALLATTGWSARRLDQRRVSGTAESARLWALRRRMDRLTTRPGLRFDAFADLTASQRDAVTARVAEAGIEESWRPFTPVEGQCIVPELSLVMRRHDAIAGWLTTTETRAGEVWYFRLSRLSAATALGATMPLIVEVNRRHYLRDGPSGRWRWNTAADQPDMLAFLDRHAASFCDFDDFYWVSEIELPFS